MELASASNNSISFFLDTYLEMVKGVIFMNEQLNKLKNALLETLPVALWVGGTAFATYLITALLDKPELAPYYGLLNIALVLVKELRK
jgi:hypothetical protein